MEKLILRLYDHLSSRKGIALAVLATVMVVCALLASRLDFKEDISAFLPQDKQSARCYDIYSRIGGSSKIAVFFQAADSSAVPDIASAKDAFTSLFCERDSLCLIDNDYLDVFKFISSNYPYFVQEEDYARMDSLLSQPAYIDGRMDELQSSLYSIGNPYSTRYFRSDPLALFSPVLQRLSRLNPSEGGNTDNIIFFDSPFGGSDSSSNAELQALLNELSSSVMKEYPGVTIFSTGGPLVAVENARQIKKDSITAASLALFLILLLLYFSYKRISDILWILVSISCGALFSLGIISLFRNSVSLIVLGIGSMMIGIAVNYPLHYIDHLKYQPDKRRALKEQINPLLIGNITTVAAFLALLFMKSEALNDFGFIAAVMLIGTILFVLIFLPVFITPSEKERNTVKLDWDRFFKPAIWTRRVLFLGFAVLTAVFAVLGSEVGFDSDLHNINYMSAEQKKGFELLAELSGNTADTRTVFLVTEDENTDKLVKDALAGYDFQLSSANDFLPPVAVQQSRLDAWCRFCETHPQLGEDLLKSAESRGFNSNAFIPFLRLLECDLQPEDLSYFEPVASVLEGSMLLADENGIKRISRLKVNASDENAVCQTLNQVFSETGFDSCFCFSDSFLSSSLTSILSDEFDEIGLFCSLIVFIFLCLSFRSLELSIVSFLPLAVGWIWILGIMHLFGIQFNIVNIILASFIFGQGDDYTIFITEGLMYEYASGRKILRSYKNCVTLSAVIMLVSMGTLVIAGHPAMKSLAYITIIGMSAVVAMAYYLPPLVFKWLTIRKGQPRQHPITLLKISRTLLMLTVFLLAMLIFTPLAMLYFLIFPESENRRLYYHKAIRWVSRNSIRMVPGAPFSQSNPYGENFDKPALIVCNHQSHLDILALLQLSPKIVALTNDWVWNNPFYGYLIRKAEFYPVSDGLDSNLPRLRSLVDRGYSIVVFPEGTRSTDCSVNRFHQGAFYLARELKIDVLPVYIHGFGNALPKKEMLLEKAPLYLEIGKRLGCNEIDDDLKQFTRSFRKSYISSFEQIRRKRENSSFYAPLVLDQYLYKGQDAFSSCRKLLVPAVFNEIDSLCPEDGKLIIKDCGYGAKALLAALVHPDIQVFAYDDDEDKLLVASRCAALPSNLKYIKL